MAKFHKEFDAHFDGKPAQVLVAAVAYGQPGIDVWIGDKCLCISKEDAKMIRDFVDDIYGDKVS